MSAVVKVEGIARLKARLRALDANAKHPVRQAIAAGALAVEREAKTSVQRGSRTGRIYYRRNRTHQASAPGEAPKSDTGYLAGRITTVVDLDGLGANVESQAAYSKALEFGTTKMAARPFLFPAFEKMKERIKRNVGDAVKAAFKKGGA
jgi:HK97 gp10 family phage protein